MKVDQIITKVIVGFPNAVLGFFILFSIGAMFFIPGLQRDPSPYLLPKTHESRLNLKELRKSYTGANDAIVVLLEAEKTVFNSQTLMRVQKLTQAFENIHLVTREDRETLLKLSRTAPIALSQKLVELANSQIDSETWMLIEELRDVAEGEQEPSKKIVEALDSWSKKLSPVIEVTSLSNTDNILGADGKLTVAPIFDETPLTELRVKRIEKEVLSNDLFKNILFSNEGKSTSIILELDLMDDRTQDQYLIYQQVKEIVEKKIPGNETHYIAGLPVVTGALGKIMEQDTGRLFPIVIAIVVGCLFFTFRRIKGILVPLAVVILSLIVTLGLKSFFSIPLNIISTTLPVFILSIGVADGIHMFSEYRDHRLSGQPKKEAVLTTLKHLTMPVIMTSVTTAAAFYAISMTQIVQLKHFGIFVCIGTLVAMVFSLGFIPALLLVLPEKKMPKKRISQEPKQTTLLEAAWFNSLVRLTKMLLKNPAVAVFAAGILLALSLYGASKVVVDNNNAKYFLTDSDIYISSEKLNADAAGSASINLLISAKTTEKEAFKNPENLNHVNNLVEYIKTLPQVGKVLGLSELIKRIYLVLNDEDPSFNRLPQASGKESKALVSQLLLLYENGGGETLSDLTDTSYTRLNIPVILQTNSSLDIWQLSKKITGYVSTHFPDHLKVDISGSANVSVAATDEIVSGQMRSLFISLGVVLVMLFFTFRKISYSLVAMVPLVMTITINFGIMGYFSIPLDIGTAVISSIVIGIGVDYSIHYLSRLDRNLNQGMVFENALENTIHHSGKAIVFNAITVGLGFVALLFSILTPLIIMGWMISITMLISAASTLMLIPVFIVFVDRRARYKHTPLSRNQLAFHPQPQK